MVTGKATMLRFAPALLLFFLMGSQEVWAADSKEEARNRFSSGQSHYNLNEFAQALQEFKEAYRLFPDPVFLYNAGQCERQLDHFEEAIAFYRSFLRNQPKAPNRSEVKRKIEEMETALKNKASAPPAEPPRLTEPAATASPTLPLEVEKPIIPAADKNQPTVPSPTEAPTPQESKPQPLPLPMAAPPTPAEPIAHLDLATPAPAITPPAVYRRWWFWTATGVVLIGATTAIVLSLSNDPSGPPTSALGGKKVY